MTAHEAQTHDDACYLALKARDARFDGCFFTGVTSTGIYCRPELAPRTPVLSLAPEARTWSIQDASSILAVQAARLLDSPQAWDNAAPTMQQLAQRLGVSDRHLRRIFEAQFGVSPLQYLQTRRLLSAKQLLTDTTLAVTQVAAMSGFASVRRFNAAFAEHYALNPTQLRRAGARREQGAIDQSIHVRLAYRPPYDVDAMLRFFGTRRITGIEVVTREPDQQRISKTVAVHDGNQLYAGWLMARFDTQRSQVDLHLSDCLRDVLPQVMARVRAMLDLDADPLAINKLLHTRFPLGDGLRVPGALDGFELAVRAVLGQQISVAAARTLATRLVERFGEPVATPIAALNRLFPGPATLAGASADALGQLGIVKQRQAAIQAIASAVINDRLQLHARADVAATVAALKALPGIGDWTAQYIAMRTLRWPDAFPSGDVALHKALGLQNAKNPAKEAQAASQAWRPWRSYAVIRAWASLAAAAGSRKANPVAIK